jgi:hypothetical protein
LRALAANLKEKRADIALVRRSDALAHGDLKRLFAVHFTGQSRVVMMMVAVVMVGVRVAVVRALHHFQAMLMTLIERQPVQSLPEQGDGAVDRQQAARQVSSICWPHRTKCQ